LRTPAESAQLRIDTGVRAGDEISQYYDPMIAKLIVWGEDRAAALRQLAAALAGYQVAGVTTNIPFLQRLIAHPAFATAQLDTGLIARNRAELFPPRCAPSDTMLSVAALAEFMRISNAAAARARVSGEPYSPWHAIDTWWLNTDDHAIALTYTIGEARYPVRVSAANSAIVVRIDDRELAATVTPAGDDLAVTLAGRRMLATVVPLGEERIVFCAGQMQRLHLADSLAHAGEDEHHGGHLTAPMSGTIVAVAVKPGDAVAKGAPLLILEAMKMEHTITAPAAGTVSAVNYRPGDQVREGADLIDLDEAPQA
jgi:3-methylcrotonyl-CoA carboxylase alpha subunit